MDSILYQVSTLQALLLGYSKGVVRVSEFLRHGNTGLGTFENVEGEMIVIDGHCYQADNEGKITEADPQTGVPFGVIADWRAVEKIDICDVSGIDELKTILNLHIDENFTLNSMHIARIDGSFRKIMARSESGLRAHHVELKDLLRGRQKDFIFEQMTGSVIAVYIPDYMDGLNAGGWHFHFISEYRTEGGHVFDLEISSAVIGINTISRIDIQLPCGPAYDTYDMKSVSSDDVRQVEQEKK